MNEDCFKISRPNLLYLLKKTVKEHYDRFGSGRLSLYTMQVIQNGHKTLFHFFPIIIKVLDLFECRWAWITWNILSSPCVEVAYIWQLIGTSFASLTRNNNPARNRMTHCSGFLIEFYWHAQDGKVRREFKNFPRKSFRTVHCRFWEKKLPKKLIRGPIESPP